MKPILKKTLFTIAFSTGLASALPIDLGAAAQYTLLASGTNIYHGQSMYGNLDLGSEAFIHVNVDYFGFMLGGGAAIVLDGIRAENVLFNMHGTLNNGHVNVQNAGHLYRP